MSNAMRGASWMRRSQVIKIVLPTVFIVLSLSLAMTYVLGRTFARIHDVHSERRAELFAAGVEEAFRRDAEGHPEAGSLLKLLCRATRESAFVAGRDHRVHVSCTTELLGVDTSGQLVDGQVVVHGGSRWVRRVHPIDGGSACAKCHDAANPIGYIAVDVPVEEAETEVRELQRASLLAAAILAAALSVMLILVQTLLVFRPVKSLMATAEKIRAGDLGARVSVSRPDEVGRLGQSLNDMAASIEEAMVELERTHRAELAQSEKLAALGQLISSIAHEIKNPLAGIIGALRVLEAQSPAEDPSKTILGKILAQMERLSNTVVASLDYARPLKSAARDIDLVDLLDHTLFFIERQAAEQGVELRKLYAPGLPRARIDPELMKQVFLNVLLNGMQAMPRGGTLEVEVKPAERDAIEVTISDQGVGIPPEDRDRIFSPFFTTKARGTGLGLYVARQIVETQRGQISVASRVGQGTSFTIRIPAGVATEEVGAHVAR